MNSLVQHECRCPSNPNRKAFDNVTKYVVENIKGQTKETCEQIKNQALKLVGHKGYWKDKKGTFSEKNHSESSKKKCSESTKEYISKSGAPGVRFSIEACSYIDKLNADQNFNFQHALNGGEIKIGRYHVDGYDKNRNIVFEYDEPKHYKDVDKNILSDYDIKRQNEIINKLHCSFMRYNSKLNLLYTINN